MKNFLLTLLAFTSLFTSISYAFELKVIKSVEGEEFYKKNKTKKISDNVLNGSDEKKLKKVYNSIIKDMVECPAGSFVMGSPVNELGHCEDETQHLVTISFPFYIGKYEVTQNLYELITGDNPSTFFAEEDEDENPVENISWDEAVEFCEKLNYLFKDFLPEGYIFDLPTESQWEYACRAGTTTALNSGKDLTSEKESCDNLDEIGWYGSNSHRRANPVGKKKPNAWEIYDMHGNVWEWCKNSFFIKNKEVHVIRGGSWESYPKLCRSAYRVFFSHYVYDEKMGFRIALVVDKKSMYYKNQKRKNKNVKLNKKNNDTGDKLEIIDK